MASSSKRKEDDKNLKLLRELASQRANKLCFDCEQKGPTYINMTIGSFVCTSCSGILRGLTPPHRVKSITMASFTTEEIDQLRHRGNHYCKAVWLGLLKDAPLQGLGSKSPDENRLRDILIDKYERKRYYIDPIVVAKNMSQEQAAATSTAGATTSPTPPQQPITPPQSTAISRNASTEAAALLKNLSPLVTPAQDAVPSFANFDTANIFTQTNTPPTAAPPNPFIRSVSMPNPLLFLQPPTPKGSPSTTPKFVRSPLASSNEPPCVTSASPTSPEDNSSNNKSSNPFHFAPQMGGGGAFKMVPSPLTRSSASASEFMTNSLIDLSSCSGGRRATGAANKGASGGGATSSLTNISKHFSDLSLDNANNNSNCGGKVDWLLNESESGTKIVQGDSGGGGIDDLLSFDQSGGGDGGSSGNLYVFQAPSAASSSSCFTPDNTPGGVGGVTTPRKDFFEQAFEFNEKSSSTKPKDPVAAGAFDFFGDTSTKGAFLADGLDEFDTIAKREQSSAAPEARASPWGSQLGSHSSNYGISDFGAFDFGSSKGFGTLHGNKVLNDKLAHLQMMQARKGGGERGSSHDVFSFDDDEFVRNSALSSPRRAGSLNPQCFDDCDSTGISESVVDSVGEEDSSEDEVSEEIMPGLPLIPIGSPSNRTLALAERLKSSTDSLPGSRNSLHREGGLSISYKGRKEQKLKGSGSLFGGSPKGMFMGRPSAIRPKELARIHQSTLGSLPDLGSNVVTTGPEMGSLKRRPFARSHSNFEPGDNSNRSSPQKENQPPPSSQESSSLMRSNTTALYSSTPSNIGATSPSNIGATSPGQKYCSPHQELSIPRKLGSGADSSMAASLSIGSLPNSLSRQQSHPPLELAVIGPVGFFDQVPSLSGLLKSNFLRKRKVTSSFDKLYETAPVRRSSASSSGLDGQQGRGKYGLVSGKGQVSTTAWDDAGDDEGGSPSGGDGGSQRRWSTEAGGRCSEPRDVAPSSSMALQKGSSQKRHSAHDLV